MVLEVLNFPQMMIAWIMECVSTPSYSIYLNGCLDGYFKGAKGLRQGDPMSPYLFILIMEGFSHILGLYTQREEFKYHKWCSELRISHLIFADDLFIMSEAEYGP